MILFFRLITYLNSFVIGPAVLITCLAYMSTYVKAKYINRCCRVWNKCSCIKYIIRYISLKQGMCIIFWEYYGDFYEDTKHLHTNSYREAPASGASHKVVTKYHELFLFPILIVGPKLGHSFHFFMIAWLEDFFLKFSQDRSFLRFYRYIEDIPLNLSYAIWPK